MALCKGMGSFSFILLIDVNRRSIPVMTFFKKNRSTITITIYLFKLQPNKPKHRCEKFWLGYPKPSHHMTHTSCSSLSFGRKIYTKIYQHPSLLGTCPSKASGSPIIGFLSKIHKTKERQLTSTNSTIDFHSRNRSIGKQKKRRKLCLTKMSTSERNNVISTIILVSCLLLN